MQSERDPACRGMTRVRSQLVYVSEEFVDEVMTDDQTAVWFGRFIMRHATKEKDDAALPQVQSEDVHGG